jgi:hypothetical protein
MHNEIHPREMKAEPIEAYPSPSSFNMHHFNQTLVLSYYLSLPNLKIDRS